MIRFQGALEYLIILGAAVLIAGIVVAYMFGFLGSGTRQNMINVCADFKNKLCQYATQFTNFGAATPAEAMSMYLSGTLLSYGANGFQNVSCTTSSQDVVSCGSITFSYNPTSNTITVSGANVYINTKLKPYYANTPSSNNDYLCLRNQQKITCT